MLKLLLSSFRTEFLYQRERRHDLMIFYPFFHNAKVVLAKIC